MNQFLIFKDKRNEMVYLRRLGSFLYFALHFNSPSK